MAENITRKKCKRVVIKSGLADKLLMEVFICFIHHKVAHYQLAATMRQRINTREDPSIGEIQCLLKTMTISTTKSEICLALKTMYPKGYNKSDLGSVARNLYKYFAHREIA
jgi:hypothetical protein